MILFAICVVVPFGCRVNISVRTGRQLNVTKRELSQANLIGASPKAVAKYLDGHGYQHNEYVRWSPYPDQKRTLVGWTTRDLGAVIHPTWLCAEGCVWITFRFDTSNRLRSYTIKQGLWGAVDS